MDKRKRQSTAAVVIMILCFVITTGSFLIGIMKYRGILRDTYQNLVHVELTGFIENTRYSLHFGKDIETFYRMNEILSEEINLIDDVDGLYVVSEDGRVLFATDGFELTRDVLKLVNANTVEGNQFFAGIPLSADGSAGLIARCSSKSLLLEQSDYIFRFLIICLIGLVLVETIMLVLLKTMSGSSHMIQLMLVVLLIWIVSVAVVGSADLYRNYSKSIEKMQSYIEEAVYRDIAWVKSQGIKDESLTELDTYFDRYIGQIDEVESISMDDGGLVKIEFKPYVQKIVFGCVIQIVCLFALSIIAFAAFQRLEGRIHGKEEGEA